MNIQIPPPMCTGFPQSIHVWDWKQISYFFFFLHHAVKTYKMGFARKKNTNEVFLKVIITAISIIFSILKLEIQTPAIFLQHQAIKYYLQKIIAYIYDRYNRVHS